MFHKPRILGLLTGRLGTPLWMRPEDRETMARRVDLLRINYLIIIRESDRYLVDQLAPAGLQIAQVWESPTYQIFKVIRP